jgi:hypothetical protein
MSLHRLPVEGEVWWHRFNGEHGAVRVLAVVADEGETVVLFRYRLVNDRRHAATRLADFHRLYLPQPAEAQP